MCICLGLIHFVLQLWSWSWFWSYNFGLGLGLNILVLFPSLLNWQFSVSFQVYIK